MPRFIDSHTHVQFPVYNSDRGAVISRSLAAGIWMVNIGTSTPTSRDAVMLAEKYPEGVYASVGFHPGHVAPTHHDEWEKERPTQDLFYLGKLRELAQHPKVVGIGECGLDYAFVVREQRERLQQRASAEALGEGELPQEEIQSRKEKQKEVFRAQIELAKELKKPLIIHCRGAFSDLIEILVACPMSHVASAGVVHFFSGTLEDARALMDLGFYLGFGGVVTFAKGYREIIESVPLEKIVLETDAPYVAPVPYRGKRNEPLYMEAVAAKIAEWKNVDVDTVGQFTTQNAKHLFSI